MMRMLVHFGCELLQFIVTILRFIQFLCGELTILLVMIICFNAYSLPACFIAA